MHRACHSPVSAFFNILECLWYILLRVWHKLAFNPFFTMIFVCKSKNIIKWSLNYNNLIKQFHVLKNNHLLLIVPSICPYLPGNQAPICLNKLLFVTLKGSLLRQVSLHYERIGLPKLHGKSQTCNLYIGYSIMQLLWELAFDSKRIRIITW